MSTSNLKSRHIKYLYSKFNMMIKLEDFDVSLLCELANKINK